jgi:predicted nucleotidyltransferase
VTPEVAATIETRLKAFFEADARGAVAVYLYGSVARGEARSDGDVGVLFTAEPPATLGAPQFQIETALERPARILSGARLPT